MGQMDIRRPMEIEAIQTKEEQDQGIIAMTGGALRTAALQPTQIVARHEKGDREIRQGLLDSRPSRPELIKDDRLQYELQT